MGFSKRKWCHGSVARWSALALLGTLVLEAAWAELGYLEQTATPIEESSLVKEDVPQGILDSILSETARFRQSPPRATSDSARGAGDLERRVAWLPGTGNDVHASSR